MDIVIRHDLPRFTRITSRIVDLVTVAGKCPDGVSLIKAVRQSHDIGDKKSEVTLWFSHESQGPKITDKTESKFRWLYNQIAEAGFLVMTYQIGFGLGGPAVIMNDENKVLFDGKNKLAMKLVVLIE